MTMANCRMDGVNLHASNIPFWYPTSSSSTAATTTTTTTTATTTTTNNNNNTTTTTTTTTTTYDDNQMTNGPVNAHLISEIYTKNLFDYNVHIHVFKPKGRVRITLESIYFSKL